ncbi:MAG: UDP-3-O-(3-hydroxymyristoyl)glucosamine N-acyltransferase [Spirochaetia bacterium]|nr:UDP-3-O-(3-hydroxymyristoyl)glucosamine N-acyltransferase [Spirochaetia bacterium]
MKLKEIAEKINIKFTGNGDLKIKGLKDIERIEHSQTTSENFLYVIESENILRKHSQMNKNTIVLCTDDLLQNFHNALYVDKSRLRLIFIELLKIFSVQDKLFNHLDTAISPKAEINDSAKIYPGAVIMQNAKIGKNCIIYSNAVIEPNAKIGDNSVIHPCCVIGYNCIIGKNSIIYSGTVIGADGFGYYDHEDGSRHKIPHIGNVIISDHVEIGANTTIDRGTIESTTVGSHTKIDNQVQIGHNCQIGSYVYIAGNSGVSGSVKIKDHVIIAGQSGIADHVTLEKKSVILGLTGVPSDTEEGKVYFGIPARPVREAHKINGALGSLPDLIKRVKKLEENK